MNCPNPYCLAGLAEQNEIPVIFWTCDSQGHFTSVVGKALLEMFPNILQRTCWDVYNCQPDHYVHYIDVLRRGRSARYTVSIKDGIWECLMFPTPDGGCQGIGVERTKEHNLREQWEMAIKSCPFAIATVAPDGTILECAPAWEKILGFDPTGRRYQEFTHPEDVAEDEGLHGRMMDGEFDSYGLVKRYIHADGRTVHVLLESGIIRTTGVSLAYVTDISKDIAMQEHRRLQAEVSTAILEEQFEIHYQPICLLSSGETVGYEALVRWNKDGELQAPGHFLPALDTRTIGLLTFEVLRLAIRDRPRLGTCWTAINLDPRSLEDTVFSTKLTRLIEISNVPPADLRFEITEQYLMQLPLVETILKGLRNRGHIIELDDVGSGGYSNLAVLTSDYFTGIKIDKSLTDKIYDEAEGTRTQKLLRTLIILAERLDMDVIVEGIENQDQVRWLLDNGYEKGQGYFFSKPLPLNAILANQD